MAPPPRSLTFAVGSSLLTVSLAAASVACTEKPAPKPTKDEKKESEDHTVNEGPEPPPKPEVMVNEGPEPEPKLEDTVNEGPVPEPDDTGEAPVEEKVNTRPEPVKHVNPGPQKK